MEMLQECQQIIPCKVYGKLEGTEMSCADFVEGM